MPSPLPGMNPFLENRMHWSTVHNALIAGIYFAVSSDLPEGFAAFIDERVYIDTGDTRYRPDTFVVRTARNIPAPATPERSGGSVAVAERVLTEVQSARLPRSLYDDLLTVRERFLEIRSVTNDRVVSVIELLSPANKARGRGREEYLDKQRLMLESDVHFIEIDLFRGGEHALAPSRGRIEREFGAFDYAVSLHRASAGNRYEVWAGPMEQMLPVLVIPLTEETPDLQIDFQEIFHQVYDTGLRRMVNYQVEPDPPLTDAQKAWAQELLMQSGLRSNDALLVSGDRGLPVSNL